MTRNDTIKRRIFCNDYGVFIHFVLQSVVGILGSTISFDLLCIRTMSHVVMSYGSKTGGDSSNVKKRISTCDVEALKNVWKRN